MDFDGADTHWGLGRSTVLSGRYEVTEAIRRGGMGIVYHGRDGARDEEIAIKVLHPFLDLAPRGVQRLKDEARTAHRLSI